MMGGSVYILADAQNKILDVGAVTDLYDHMIKQRSINSSQGPNENAVVTKLVYVETYLSMKKAIARQKQIKKYDHPAKVELVNSLNPEWADLFEVLGC